jgi:hypothetical protein
MDTAATSVCTTLLTIIFSQRAHGRRSFVCTLDLGNGEFEPVYATQGGVYPQHYGATNA